MVCPFVRTFVSICIFADNSAPDPVEELGPCAVTTYVVSRRRSDRQRPSRLRWPWTSRVISHLASSQVRLLTHLVKRVHNTLLLARVCECAYKCVGTLL